jgi:hypothetical protein
MDDESDKIANALEKRGHRQSTLIIVAQQQWRQLFNPFGGRE